MIDAYHFGPVRESGHFWWASENSAHVREYADGRPEGCPWGFECDGRMQPWPHLFYYGPDPQPQGGCAIHRAEGWTLIAWWDRSVDKRGGCCSAFALAGEHTFEGMVVAFAARFPGVAARQPVPLYLVTDPDSFADVTLERRRAGRGFR